MAISSLPATRTTVSAADLVDALTRHQHQLRQCRRCPGMHPPVITGLPVATPVYLIGQAPGGREGSLGRPFAWTAGRTLFQWFARCGMDEPTARARIYIAAVCRCFPGKQRGGGDRVPDRTEIRACRSWLEDEIALLQPTLVIPVGRLAIDQVLPGIPLCDAVGQVHHVAIQGRACDILPLPHPSGASSWWKREPGRGLLERALTALAVHPQWRSIALNGPVALLHPPKSTHDFRPLA